jgi:hypothetical protein
VLDLRHTQIPFQFAFLWCNFCHEIILIGAALENLELDHTYIRGLTGDSMTVKQNIGLRNGFVSRGRVRLLGVTCGSILSCLGGTFINPEDVALDIQLMRVGNTVLLREGFLALGEVRAVGISITSDLDCRLAMFINPAGRAIYADKANISGTVFLSDGFVAEGEVRFSGGTIGGGLDCHFGSFVNPDDTALNLYIATVKGDLSLVGNPKIMGELYFHGVNIIGSLKVLSMQQHKTLKLILDAAHVQTLHDEEQSWVEEGNLSLHGFEYRYIQNESPKSHEHRLQWLQLQPNQFFSPQPYEQLAKVLRESGHDRDAKEILIAKERDRTRWGNLSNFTKFKRWWLRWVIAYGYQPFRALWWMLGIVLLGTFIFHSTSASISRVDSNTTFPPFNAFMYSLDTFLPIIDFHQDSEWLPYQPNPSPASTLSTVCAQHPVNWCYVWNWIISRPGVLYYYWLHILLGWIFTSFFVAGLTGLIRR